MKKKTLTLLLAAVVAATVLAGCSDAGNMSGSQLGELISDYSNESDKKDSVPTSRESSVTDGIPSSANSETKSSQAQVIQIDQEQIDYMNLSDDQQYEINVFLSNFAEQWFAYEEEFDVNDASLNDLVEFTYLHNKINIRNNVKVEEAQNLSGEFGSYYTISLNTVNTTLTRFFGLSYTDQQVQSKYDNANQHFYANGTFYFPAADGAQYNQFAVADSMYEMDGKYIVNFTVYELDLETYGDDPKALTACYKLRPDAAAANKKLTKVKQGKAVVVPYKYKNRDSYHLITYKLS